MLLIVFGVSTVRAQGVTTSSISGVVTDSKGEPLPGATVVAVHTPSGTNYGTTTNTQGQYNFPAVRIGGPYTLTISYVGYTEKKVENLTANLGAAANADVILAEEGKQLTEVVVSGARSSVINSNRTGAATGISNTQITTLPTLNRSFADFTRLDARANGLSFAGRNSGYNNFTVDGAIFNNAFGLSSTVGGQAGAQPISIDAIDQIQVTIAPYDVRQGAFTGAGINAVTRSGSNKVQGSVYYYVRDQSFVGKKIAGQEQPINNFSLNNIGFRLGGPIIKNKLFLFVNYERERRNDGVPGNWVAARSGLTGDNVSRSSAADLDRLSTFIQQQYGFNPGPYENYTLPSNSDKGTARLDWNISQNHKLNIKYNFLTSYADITPSSSGALPQGRGPNVNALPYLSSFYRINNNLQSVIGELNSTFGSKFANTLQAGYSAFRDFRESPYLPSTFPLVDIGNGSGTQLTSFGYEPFSAFNILNSNVFQISDNFTIFAGKHTFTLGTYNEFYSFRNGFAPNYYGNYQFASVDAFISNATQTPIAGGTTIANPTRFQIQYSALPDGSFPYADIKAAQYSAYVQDEYQARRNLKFTIGLRADVPTIPTEIQQNTNLLALTGFRDGVRLNTAEFPKASLLFSPRVGFNWDVNDDRITQIRGGAGVFTGRVPYVWISNQASNNGVLFGSSQINNPPATGDNARPFSPDVNRYRPAGAAANTSYNIAIADPNFKFPQVFRANLGIDRNLGKGFILTLEGIFTKDINAVYHQNVNLPNSTQNLRGPDGGDNRPIYYTNNTAGLPSVAYNRIYGQNATTGAALSGTAVSASSPIITDAILMRNTNQGYSYNLTAEISKQFANGFYAKAAYSYTDSRSVNDGGSIAQSIWRDRSISGDPNANVLSYSSFLQPHRVIGVAAYRFEYANKHAATTVSLFYNGASGNRYSYVYAGDLNGDAQNSNDLIFVPRTQDDIRLRDVTATTGGVTTVTYSAADQWRDLNNYIDQDPYLSKRRGQYTERNGAMTPFISRLDLKILQEFGLNIGKTRHAFQVSLDVFNVGNLINSNWGNAQTAVTASPISFVGYDNGTGGTGRPVFQFPYLDATNRVARTNTFQVGSAIANRWQAQLGLRYIFN
ncbi:carboxypeptidase regulatory-like domain-containing protein [Spirosoma rhododendri]|uniref:Carboxypeptidase regulatory-like domain-containing protein n=2 Tax=Spirosoma rhododendri TaxID=2728024 RepID=A0A7L5DSK3_9BACT|nr:carboxypeptidase regulatory-like domain-containing protein [Spirosoma rhododendri]